MKTTLLWSIACLLLLVASSCKEDDVVDPCGDNGELCKYSEGIMIINEGQFLTGNASVTYYDPNTKTTEETIFQTVNSRALGDIAQSVTVTDDHGFIVVNNSQKIEVVVPGTMAETATITGFTSPRYIFPVSNSKAYVSDIGGKCYVVDLTSMSITKELTMDGWTENMVLVNGEVYVVQRTSYLVGTEVSNVTVINTTTDEVTATIDVRPNPSSIAVDADQNIWVVCGGDSLNGSALMAISPTLKRVYKTINIEDKTFFGGPSAVKIGPNGRNLYYLNNGLYKVSVDASTEPSAAFIAPTTYSIYDFGIDPNTGDIYCTDAVDFVQTGNVIRYDNTGTMIDEFTVGVVPGDFAFN